MLRGVSRYTVEVNRTGSPYFERAICFVRPEFARCDRVDLHRAAYRMVRTLDDSLNVTCDDAPDIADRPKRRILRRILGMLASALLGAAAAIAACILAGGHIAALPFI